MDFLNLEYLRSTVFFGNSLYEYVWALGLLSVLLVVFKLIQWVILFRLEKLADKTKTEIDNTLIDIFRSIKPPFYFFLAFWIAVRTLNLNEIAGKIVDSVLIIYVVYQVIIAVQILIEFIVTEKIKDKSSRSVAKLISKISKGVLWVLGILLILSNLGINVTSLIAGLGIGGVAVALALQNILGDLFSSFAIHFDKPFQVGDFIVVGDDMGEVKKIGIKTTRLQSLQGEETVLSNAELTSSRIHNYKKMEKRRVLFSFGVTYDTHHEKLERIPGIVRNIVEKVDSAEFDRSNFHEFGDSALLFENVYYVLTGDYNEFMNVNQEIHLKIKKSFDEEGISMAFPTRTVYLEK